MAVSGPGRTIRVFVKLGGSFISPKRAKREMLLGSRVRTAAREIRRAIEWAAKDNSTLSLVLGHGAGKFGHAPAKGFNATKGRVERFGWTPLHTIRESMMRMNLRFVEQCRRGGLFPLTVSPFATAEGRGGRLNRLDLTTTRQLLKSGQIPLVHGDIILDTRQGFGIASTEALLVKMAEELVFDRIVMVTDVDGVHARDGSTIPLITPDNRGRYLDSVRGSRGTDVTGGMSDKVANLLKLVESGRVKEARIIGCGKRPRDLCEAILGTGNAGTRIARS